MNKIPEVTLQRLPVYLNYLKELDDSDYTVSSRSIATALKLGEVLVRKDLAMTSAIGRPKIGYIRTELISALEEDLGCKVIKNAVLVGCGGLGHALMCYNGFGNYGINIVAGFDNDRSKIGTTINNKPVLDGETIPSNEMTKNSDMAIICVPKEVAQLVCDKLVKAGIKAILNFSPTLLHAPEEVVIRDIDVAASLAVLASL